MWCIFDEVKCRQKGWFDAYRSYFLENDIDTRVPVERKTVRSGVHATYNLTTKSGKILSGQVLDIAFFPPLNDKPIEEGEFL